MKEKDPAKVSWKQMFLFTRDGNLQNMDFMYAFFLSVVLLFVNFFIGNRVTILFESLFSDASRMLKNILDIVIPAGLCTAAAVLLFRVIRKKKIVLMAYVILLVITVVFIVTMAVMYDKETMEVLLPSLIGIFLVPSLTSLIGIVLLYRKWQANNPDPKKEEERELARRDGEH